MNTRAQWVLGALCFAAAFTTSAPTMAVPITSFTVDSKSSIYGVEGYSGSKDYSSIPATLIEFVAATGNEFEVLSSVPSGERNPSNSAATFSLDGNKNHRTVIDEYNGLSSSQGNTFFGLLGVFIDSLTFDSTGTAPTPLVWDADNPTSVMPALNQIFYIGDGREGFDNSTGGVLVFTAPDAANRLYLGFADGGGVPKSYQNNEGFLQASITLNTTNSMAPATVSLPGTLALSAIGLCALGWSRRRA